MLKVNTQTGNFVQFLWHGFYPWDVRLEKFLEVCQTIGLQTGVIGRNVGEAPKTEYIDGAKIQRIGRGDSNISKTIYYPIFCNPVFILKVDRLISENHPALLLVRDLPLGMLALYFGCRYKIPVVLDMAENYPAALIAYENPVYRSFLFSNAFLPRYYEKFVVRNIDAVVVVAQEQVNRLTAMGVQAKKIHLVQNTPTQDFIDNIRPSSQVLKASVTDFKPLVLYVGKIDIHRGIRSLIEAFSLIVKKEPNAGLVLVGDGKERASLEQLACQKGLQKNVVFSGWVDHSEIPHFIRQSDICCIPHLKSEHTDTTIPNKLFDYMALGKPVLVSNLDPVQNIVNKIKCGCVFKSNDPVSLAEQFFKVFGKMDSWKMGLHGREAVLHDYNWECDARRLETALLSLMKP